MKTLTLTEEYQTFQKLYGNYYVSQMFHDFNGYKLIRDMNSFQDIADELLSLEQIQD